MTESRRGQTPGPFTAGRAEPVAPTTRHSGSPAIPPYRAGQPAGPEATSPTGAGAAQPQGDLPWLTRFSNDPPPRTWEESFGHTHFIEVNIPDEPSADEQAERSGGREASRGLDPRRVEEIARRLEHLAWLLRDGGPQRVVAERATDPLGALLTGYLSGLAEMEGRG